MKKVLREAARDVLSPPNGMVPVDARTGLTTVLIREEEERLHKYCLSMGGTWVQSNSGECEGSSISHCR